MSALPLQHTPPEAQPSPLKVARGLAGIFRERAARSDREGRLDLDAMRQLRRSGLAALAVPHALGGPEAPFPLLVDVVAEIAQADPSIALVLAMQLFQTQCIARSETWPAAVREGLLRSVLEDGALVNALRVEPEQGSPIRGGLPATLAVRDAKGWRITGRKLYSTGSQALAWGIVWGRSEDGRIGEFLVPMDAPGVSIEETWDHAGLRASGSHDVIFDEVLVPFENAVDIRPPPAWKGRDETRGAWLSVLLAALYGAVAVEAVDWWQHWVHSRVPSNLGAPLSTLPRFRAAAGEVQALLQTNRVLLWAAKHQFDSVAAEAIEKPPHIASDLLKYTVTQNAIAAVSRAVEVSGNHGLTRANPLERHLRNVLCSRVHHPQNDLILEAAGGREFPPAPVQTT